MKRNQLNIINQIIKDKQNWLIKLEQKKLLNPTEKKDINILTDQITELKELKTFKKLSDFQGEEKQKRLETFIYCYNYHKEPDQHLTDEQINSIKTKDFFVETQELDKDGNPFIFTPTWYRPANKYTFKISKNYKLLYIIQTEKEHQAKKDLTDLNDYKVLKDLTIKDEQPAQTLIYNYFN